MHQTFFQHEQNVRLHSVSILINLIFKKTLKNVSITKFAISSFFKFWLSMSINANFANSFFSFFNKLMRHALFCSLLFSFSFWKNWSRCWLFFNIECWNNLVVWKNRCLEWIMCLNKKLFFVFFYKHKIINIVEYKTCRTSKRYEIFFSTILLWKLSSEISNVCCRILNFSLLISNNVNDAIVIHDAYRQYDIV